LGRGQARVIDDRGPGDRREAERSCRSLARTQEIEILYQNIAAGQVELPTGRAGGLTPTAIPPRRETPVNHVSNILTRHDHTSE